MRSVLFSPGREAFQLGQIIGSAFRIDNIDSGRAAIDHATHELKHFPRVHRGNYEVA